MCRRRLIEIKVSNNIIGPFHIVNGSVYDSGINRCSQVYYYTLLCIILSFNVVFIILYSFVYIGLRWVCRVKLIKLKTGFFRTNRILFNSHYNIYYWSDHLYHNLKFNLFRLKSQINLNRGRIWVLVNVNENIKVLNTHHNNIPNY